MLRLKKQLSTAHHACSVLNAEYQCMGDIGHKSPCLWYLAGDMVICCKSVVEIPSSQIVYIKIPGIFLESIHN